MAITTGIIGLPFPFLPRHLTIVTALTIGIPSFVLALTPNRDPVAPGHGGPSAAVQHPRRSDRHRLLVRQLLGGPDLCRLDARGGPHDGDDRAVHRRPGRADRRRPAARAVEGRADRGDGRPVRAVPEPAVRPGVPGPRTGRDPGLVLHAGGLGGGRDRRVSSASTPSRSARTDSAGSPATEPGAFCRDREEPSQIVVEVRPIRSTARMLRRTSSTETIASPTARS